MIQKLIALLTLTLVTCAGSDVMAQGNPWPARDEATMRTALAVQMRMDFALVPDAPVAAMLTSLSATVAPDV